MNVENLLKPKKIALIGASEKDGFGGDTAKNLLKNADTDNIYFVNPKRDEIFGHKCYPSMDDIPGNIDQLIISTNKRTVIGLLRDGAKKGVTSAVVFASGYSETGKAEDKADEEELQRVSEELGITLMGPNCAGYVNYIDEITGYAFSFPERERKGAVALVSQSGQLCLSAMDSQNMRMSYNISAGNCAVVKMEDYLEYLVEDEDTKVIALHLEGVQNPEKLEKSLKRAAEIRKPIVMIKIGRSEKGSITAASHTGSLSGADNVIDAVFDKFGVIRVDDLQELFSTAMTLASWETLPEMPTYAITAFSGGESGIAADVADQAGLVLPDFEEKTVKNLEEQMPSYASVNNPLDMTATLSFSTELYADALKTVMADANVGAIILGFTLTQEINDPAIHYMAPGIEQALAEAEATKPLVMMPFMENTRNFEYQERLLEAGVPILPPTKYALPILKKIADYSEYDPTGRTLELALPTKPLGENRRALTEIESMDILKEYGVTTPISKLARAEEEAVTIAKSVNGPVVLKVVSEDIQHKTDVGGVQLNIEGEEAVVKAFNEIMESAQKHMPDANIEGINVQEMVAQGLEVIIGVQNDPQFGPTIMVGLGGVFVEIFKDTALYPAPLNADEAVEMIKSLKAWPLFEGYRGGKPLDVDALAQTIVSISNLAADKKDSLQELDINPIFVYEEGQGVCAADALVVLNK